ncbi:MAG: alanine--tRNA ligase-related protein, partial [Phycisphaerae bacterium]
MNSGKVREEFLQFFASKDHAIVGSSPVVPFDDPTLMFTNAGMNQFKDVFLAKGSRPYRRAVDTQKCIRAGGKHNDLDDVGRDTYHHTFFEMLGNWSFGDYFKKEAIEWAWELLTGVWGIEKARLHATYFQGDQSEGLEPDSEAAELWRTVTDINPTHIHPGDKKDNFWEMGDTGPCGPCSEIHIDLTPDASGAALVNAGDPRVIELWNLVFIQFNRGSDGKLTPLPAKHVDTGMGFERLCAVLAGKETGKLGQVSNYDTDVFTPILDAIYAIYRKQKKTGARAYEGRLPPDTQDRDKNGTALRERDASDRTTRGSPESSRGLTPKAYDAVRGGFADAHNQAMIDVSYRVIADHIRCLTFALTDGAIPDRDGRGGVLRSMLRRAVRYGRQYLNMREPFLCDLVKPLVDHMGEAFPELRTAHGGRNIQHVTELIREEEAAFFETLDRGLRHHARACADAVGEPYARLLSKARGGTWEYAGPESFASFENADKTLLSLDAAQRLTFSDSETKKTIPVERRQA